MGTVLLTALALLVIAALPIVPFYRRGNIESQAEGFRQSGRIKSLRPPGQRRYSIHRNCFSIQVIQPKFQGRVPNLNGRLAVGWETYNYSVCVNFEENKSNSGGYSTWQEFAIDATPFR
jgi:hypothetical protein